MQIIPAIDLKDGKAVRLTKGDMQKCKIYGESVDFAREFEKMGAEWLHIVDLDGAFAGSPKNLAQIKQIRESCGLKIQLGGGIRDEVTIKKYVDLGISRVILGSIALKNPTFALEMAQIYPIAIGIDAKNGKISVNGWAEDSAVNAVDFAAQFKDSAIQAIICTDISRDGTLQGVNINFSAEIADICGIPTIASGGFESNSEIEILSQKGISGVIVGKAFYEGKIDLEQTFKKYRKKL
ncbi:1-(5-phosphoribosyl)-5-[(5-phosphoribosylamino)methylideneamino]imidazole-4-carboxamide isomerase [Helicobacter sp. 23-1045]